MTLASRYYDIERKGFLNKANIAHMARDASMSDEQIKHTTATLCKTNKIEINDFVKMAKKLPANRLDGVCRFPTSILSQIYDKIKNIKLNKQKQLMSKSSCKQNSVSTRNKDSGCMHCREQDYDYANHCVTIDTIGRCVEPKIISKSKCCPVR